MPIVSCQIEPKEGEKKFQGNSHTRTRTHTEREKDTLPKLFEWCSWCQSLNMQRYYTQWYIFSSLHLFGRLFLFPFFRLIIRNKNAIKLIRKNFNYFQSLKFQCNDSILCVSERASIFTQLFVGKSENRKKLSHWKQYKNRIENRLTFDYRLNIIDFDFDAVAAIVVVIVTIR